MHEPMDGSGSWPVITSLYYTGPERRQQDRKGSPRLTPVRVLLRRLWSLIAYSDTTPVRAILAVAAALWAILLFMPGETIAVRPVYRTLAELTGTNADLKWACAWTLLACCLTWRLFSAQRRAGWALTINVFASVMFSVTPLSILWQQPYPIPAGIAPEVAMALAAYWATVRTNINTVHGWRGD